jgi:hypothetical protein
MSAMELDVFSDKLITLRRRWPLQDVNSKAAWT